MSVQEATTIVQHEPLLSRAWRDGSLRYEVAMNLIIIVLIVAAILHMRSHHIPLDEYVGSTLLGTFILWYAICFLGSCVMWVSAFGFTDESLFSEIYFIGRMTHTLGFCVFLCLLYSISHLALYIALLCFLWFVSALFAPCCPQLWRGEPAWWNFFRKQPQSTVSIV
ncbi:hypothetical protein CARUB_v10021646mg [Capsella rubella]|uniref:Transmembrane protein n=1 Tax=Capsella rubella TaxID=81985 RepID=R0HWD0_9BRAS|nr:uncharacterized protein LOC17895202 [Capsella rubella]EOA34144.1 hypothetical protein CARUB_v10021646mg [Capsella rubella]